MNEYKKKFYNNNEKIYIFLEENHVKRKENYVKTVMAKINIYIFDDGIS